MRINSKLRSASLVPVLMAMIIGSTFIFSYYRMKEVQGNIETVRDILKSTGELNSLATEYIFYHTERPRQQFLELHDLTTRLISGARFYNREQQRLYDSICNNTASMKDFFLRLVSNYDSFALITDKSALREVEERLAGQIIVKARQVAADVSRMERLIKVELTAAGARTNTLLYLVIVIAALSLTYVLVRTGKSITLNLETLRKGTEIVASGNLHHRIGIAEGDEIGDVSRAFDNMTERLRITTVSRDELSREVEERRRAQEELRAQREWLQVTLRSIGDAVLATDAEGRVIFLNPAGAALTGWEPEEAEGKPIQNVFRIINEKTREGAEDVVDLVLKKGRMIELSNHTALVSRNGREIPIEDSAAPIRDSSGNIIGVVIVFHDVEEKRRTQEELRASEERYRTLFDTMTEGFALHEIITDEHGRPCDYQFLDLNPAFERQTGLKRADLAGKRVLEALPGTEFHWIENYGRVAMTGEPFHMENYSAVLDRWYDVIAYRSGPGKFAVVFSDITERKKVEQALRESEHRFRMALRNAPVSVAAQDRELRYTWAYNQRTARPEEIIGHTDNEIFTPEEAAHFIAIKRRVLEENIELREQMWLNRPSGRIFLDLYWEPIHDDWGNVTGVGSATVDLTPIKRVEEALRESEQKYKSLSSELEVRVQARTAELERKNEELQEFAFVASHDLNEPLRKIQTFGSFLEVKGADRLNEELRDYISRITKSANRMQELLAALLSYSRIEAKGVEFRPTPLDDVVRDAITDMEVGIKAAGARLSVESLPTVMGDPNQIRQMFQNLIGNAIKYRRNGVTTAIRIRGEQSDGSCRILVEDNGIGFDEKYLGKIFQPFQRLHGKHECSGTGIGLAICRKVVERHGGTITAKSTPGQGSTFIVTLPTWSGK
ncbi:MAG: PAS domain S-box protein [Desulfobacteraceae bacterium]|nr:MAG: PAS domain S-box protein [Desulfobacteraceae bacterium]